jgi:phenylalanyl-tRNA synthetase beta chain
LSDALIPVFKQISRFPSVSRDIAIIIDEKISAQEIKDNIFATVKRFSEQTGIYFEKNVYQSDHDVVIFDVYQGSHIAKGKKSLALQLSFQNFSRTLLDEEINDLVDLIINGLNEKFQAILRG